MATPCSKHPGFNGLRLGKKAAQCPGCLEYYNARKAQGDKESRNRKKKTGAEEVPVVEKEKIEEVEEEVVVEETEVEEDVVVEEDEIDDDDEIEEDEDNDDDDDEDEEEVGLDDIQDLL